MNELYQTLGVSPRATREELKRAYRKLAKQLHPDLHPDDPRAEARFKEVNEAYEVLGDPDKRKEYDAAQNRTASPGAAGRPKRPAADTPRGGPVDFSRMQGGFASFFGFDPRTGQVTDESKLTGQGKKNPLDASDIFERFMGFR